MHFVQGREFKRITSKQFSSCCVETDLCEPCRSRNKLTCHLTQLCSCMILILPYNFHCVQVYSPLLQIVFFPLNWTSMLAIKYSGSLELPTTVVDYILNSCDLCQDFVKVDADNYSICICIMIRHQQTLTSYWNFHIPSPYLQLQKSIKCLLITEFSC